MSLSLIKTDNKNRITEKLFSEWKKITVSANEAFKQGHAFYADCLYEKAADKAKYLFSKIVCDKDSIAALLVSLHNLAYFHLANNNKRYALECLNEAVLCLSKRLKQNKIDCRKEADLIWGLRQANQQLWLVGKINPSSCVFRAKTTVQ